MKTLLLVATCNLITPLAIASNEFVDDAPPKFIHILEKEDNSKDRFDSYICTSKIVTVTLCEMDGNFEVRVATMAINSHGDPLLYSIPFTNRESASKCVARILLIMNQAEQVGAGQAATRSESKSEGGDKPQPEAEGRSR